jgi:sirohydrochlorin ferrochelatase
MRHPPLTRPTRLVDSWPPPLIAVAHGSSDPRAAATVTELMDLVRARAAAAGLPGLQAQAAYLGHALPSVPDALAALCPAVCPDQPERYACTTVVLPLLLTAAYHSDADLPAVLAQAGARLPRLRISYGQPLGPHQKLLHALDQRLAEASVPTAAGTAIVLAAAGSSRPAANAAVARMAAAWQRASGWAAVVPAYASAAGPRPGDVVASLLRAGARQVAVATYLLAPGAFADQIRERSLAAGASAVSAPLGSAPQVADVIVERYLQAAELAAGVARGAVEASGPRTAGRPPPRSVVKAALGHT